MKLLDLLRAPWAIEPAKLREIQDIYATHLRGDKIDIAAVEARMGRPLASDQQEYSVQGVGVGVLPIEGVIAPKANLFTRISGGASADMLRLQLESAMADTRVRSVVLLIDSPGGSAFGGPELAAAVREYSSIKPIVALAEAQIGSMAYWIGTAANAIFLTGPTVVVGSIGVVMAHDFTPRRDAVAGGQTTEITAGRYKRIDSDKGPLTAEGRAYMQEQADYLYSVFVDAVAANRGVDSDIVLERMADGRVFYGQQAIDAGLADGFMTLDALVEQLSADPAAFSVRRKAQPKAIAAVAVDVLPMPTGAGAALPGTTATLNPTEEPTMSGTQTPPAAPALNRASIEADHPALFAQLRTEFTAAGVAAELQRQKDVRAQSIKGHEALIEKLAADGTTTGPDAAMAVNAAMRSAMAAAEKAHAADAPEALKPSGGGEGGPAAKTKDQQVAEAQAYANEHKVSLIDALKKLGFAA